MEANGRSTGGPDKAGSINTNPVRYDFERPNRLSKDQIKRIEYLHTPFAKRLSVSLAGLVRDYVEVGVSQVIETHWSELIETIPKPCAVLAFAAEPFDGSGIISVDPKLAFGFVDRLFGGRGEAVDMQRELTLIEQSIVGMLGDAVLKEVEFAWRSVVILTVTPTGFASSPDFMRDSGVAATRFTSSPDFTKGSGINESVIVVRLEVRTNSLQGDIVIGYPYLMFEPAIRAFVKPSVEKRKGPDRDRISGILNSVTLRLSARLAPSMISMRHLVGLAVGDVLLLDNRVSDDVEILVEDKATLAGRPGEEGGRLAIKVTGFLGGGGK
jgi:flagellar motor switch protein FliM